MDSIQKIHQDIKLDIIGRNAGNTTKEIEKFTKSISVKKQIIIQFSNIQHYAADLLGLYLPTQYLIKYQSHIDRYYLIFHFYIKKYYALRNTIFDNQKKEYLDKTTTKYSRELEINVDRMFRRTFKHLTQILNDNEYYFKDTGLGNHILQLFNFDFGKYDIFINPRFHLPRNEYNEMVWMAEDRSICEVGTRHFKSYPSEIMKLVERYGILTDDILHKQQKKTASIYEGIFPENELEYSTRNHKSNPDKKVLIVSDVRVKKDGKMVKISEIAPGAFIIKKTPKEIQIWWYGERVMRHNKGYSYQFSITSEFNTWTCVSLINTISLKIVT